MTETSLSSLADYTQYVADMLRRASVERSTVAIWSASQYTGTAEGEVFFTNGIRLRMREELDFDAALITSYGYEVYQDNERLYWYDDFPHPNDPELESTFPHHKHVPPNIKRHRIPAPGLRFDRPNLAELIREIEGLNT